MLPFTFCSRYFNRLLYVDGEELAIFFLPKIDEQDVEPHLKDAARYIKTCLSYSRYWVKNEKSLASTWSERKLGAENSPVPNRYILAA